LSSRLRLVVVVVVIVVVVVVVVVIVVVVAASLLRFVRETATTVVTVTQSGTVSRHSQRLRVQGAGSPPHNANTTFNEESSSITHYHHFMDKAHGENYDTANKIDLKENSDKASTKYMKAKVGWRCEFTD